MNLDWIIGIKEEDISHDWLWTFTIIRVDQ